MRGREEDITNVGGALKKMLQTYSIDRKYDQMELITSWRMIVGEPIANRTERIFIKNDILFVELSSASLKQELIMSKSKILEKIEKELGHLAVNSIQFL